LAEPGHAVHLLGASEAQHPAHHVSILLVPAVVAHRAPTSVVEDLHPSLVGTGAVHQPNHPLLGGCHWGERGRSERAWWHLHMCGGMVAPPLSGQALDQAPQGSG